MQKELTQEEFIALFPNTRFRYIHDSINGLAIQGSNMLNLSWNEEGYGIFFTVNGFPPTGKADQSQLLSLNGNYVDFDVEVRLSQEEKDRLIQGTLMSGLETGVPTPTIINRTQKGAHLIWLYPEPLKPTLENITKWRTVQKRLVQCFNGDKNPTDPSRVLRLPYTLHLKDPNNPFEIKIVSYKPEAKCTLEELDGMVPKYSDNESDTKTPAMELLLKGVPIGKSLRHGALAQIAGLLLKNADTAEKVEIARMNYYAWDQKIVGSKEQFEERKKELDNTFEGILKLNVKDRETGTKARMSSTNRPRLWTIGEILEQDFGEEKWLVDSLISKQGMMALSGNPGDFKTWVTIHIALCVSRNLPVFGKFKASQGGVLIIDEEDHIRLLQKRLELLGAKETDNIHYLSQSGIKVDMEEVRDMILGIVKEKNIKLVILDSLVRVHGQDENDAGGMAKVFSNLQKIITEGASILFTHHHRKQQKGQGSNNPGQSMRGSSDILAAVDCHMTIEKKNENEDRLILRQTKLRQGELLPPFEINIIKSESGPSGFEYAGDHDEKKKKAEEVETALVSFLGEEMKSRSEILEFFEDDYGRDVIDRGIKLAEDDEKVERVPKGEVPKENRKKAHYRLPWILSPIKITQVNELPASVSYIEAGKQEGYKESFECEEVEKDEDGIDNPPF
ncbi:MAG: AAA family ATPase [Candidatus Paceibacterota bacterium]